MAKRIVFCADGTWEGPRSGTNVYRLYKALTVSAEQVTFYDEGVGANAKGFDRLWDAATGEGLVEKIMAAYATIANAYEPSDAIYLFGFSRGAYTARCLAGFIATCGLPAQPVTDTCVKQAFAAYRNPKERKQILAGLATCGLADVPIQMVGVWDTVGALGIPAIFGLVDTDTYGFLDTGLHPDVKHAYHAVALDEQRRQFPATLWTSAPAKGQTIEQVWFTGCHSDVGGGIPLGGGVDAATRLCDIPLGWMVGKALALGLTMDPAVAAQFAELPAIYAFDKYTDSWACEPVLPPLRRPVADDAAIGNSVALRVQYGLGDYAPGNLKIVDGAVGGMYTIVPVLSE